MSLPRQIRRAPGVFAAALLFALPVCLAEAAEASATSSSAFERSPAVPGQTGLGTPTQSPPRTSPGQSLSASLPPYRTNPTAEDLAEARRLLAAAQAEQARLEAARTAAALRLTATRSRYEEATAQVSAAQARLAEADAALQAAVAQLSSATTDVEDRVARLTAAQSEVAAARSALTAAQSTEESRLAAVRSAGVAHSAALSAESDAESEVADAAAGLSAAREAYDTDLIPDPTWIAPTYQKENTRSVPYTEVQTVRTLVPHTTTWIDTQTIPNLLFNSALTNTEGWSGVYAGWQGSSPSLIDNQVTFSYTNQSVSQGLFSGPFQNATLTLSADWKNDDLNRGMVDTYSMTVEARDVNQNPVGTATYTSTGSHDWQSRSVTLQATGPVSYITVTFTGIDSGFWYGTYGPTFKNPTLSVTHGQEVTETTYEEVITYEEVTKYHEETYYTTELVLTEGTVQVAIDEGGSATFTAPEGATFTYGNLRYEAKDRPECGVDIFPSVQGRSTVTIEASNGVWGDPCGGWYKHVVGTLSYLGQPTAPLVHDPQLLPAVTLAETRLTAAETALSTARSTVALAAEQLTEATALATAATSTRTAAEQVVTERVTVQESVAQEVAVAETALTAVQAQKVEAETVFTTAQETVATAASTHAAVTTELESAAAQETTVVEQLSAVVAAVETRETEVVAIETELAKPEPVEPEPGSPDLPENLSADNLMTVDLTAVDPSELSDAQVEQLQEAALETFLTAEQSSPEYEQALDALYLAAEADDIVLDPALAAIPGLAAATELLNFFGNAGADMSPKVREESKKIVVTAVVAAGVAVQAAAGAATSAAVSAGGSGGSTGSRRIGK